MAEILYMPIIIPTHDHAGHTHESAAEQGPDTARSLKIILAAGLILIAGVALLIRSSQSVKAELVRMDGPVKIYNDKGEWAEAKLDATLKPGARFKTTDGYAVVAIKDSFMRLATNTEVELEAVGTKAVRIRVFNGRVYSRVHAGDTHVWQVLNERATVTALGTAFAVSGNPDKHWMGLDVIDGTVTLAVTNDDADVESIIPAGTYVAVNFNKPALESIARAVMNPADAHKDTFLGWNLKEDADRDEALGAFAPTDLIAVAAEVPLVTAPGPTPAPAPTPVPAPQPAAPKPVVKPAPKPAPQPATLSLSATRTEFGINLRWTTSSSAGFQGYKVVRSTEDPNLSYPKNGYVAFFPDRSANGFLDTGVPQFQTVYYRICALEKDRAPVCGNVVKIQ